ncbi:MAG: rhomboid family intramembrane serine protease [Lachnospiraceae bacterium]
MRLLDKLEKKFGKYAIKNLMNYIIVLYAIGFVLMIFMPTFYSEYLSLNVAMILRGQIWRIVTFIIYPPNGSFLFILFSLYLYYMIGTILERQWGAFRFNVYYFTGMIFHVIAAFIAYLGWGLILEMGTYYLNLSMFFAFAVFYPDMQFLFMFIIPIKLKWLAMIDGIYFAVTIICGLFSDYLNFATIIALARVGIIANKAYAIAALVSLLNFLLFATSIRSIRRMSPKEIYRRKSFEHKVQKAQPAAGAARHKCAICGRTEKDDENLEFRYCSKCEGNYEYCQDHLFTHTHVKK